jgi:hypothetical protein
LSRKNCFSFARYSQLTEERRTLMTFRKPLEIMRREAQCFCCFDFDFVAQLNRVGGIESALVTVSA